jgi:hypothetical protein
LVSTTGKLRSRSIVNSIPTTGAQSRAAETGFFRMSSCGKSQPASSQQPAAPAIITSAGGGRPGCLQKTMMAPMAPLPLASGHQIMLPCSLSVTTTFVVREQVCGRQAATLVHTLCTCVAGRGDAAVDQLRAAAADCCPRRRVAGSRTSWPLQPRSLWRRAGTCWISAPAMACVRTTYRSHTHTLSLGCLFSAPPAAQIRSPFPPA